MVKIGDCKFFEHCSNHVGATAGGNVGVQLKAAQYSLFCVDCAERVCGCCTGPHYGHKLVQVRSSTV